MNLYTAQWNFRFCGLRLFANLHTYLDKTMGIVVPYWMLAVPLTLFSAWLLLSKVREQEKHEGKIDTL
jgi:hypothetical protein